MYVCVCVCIHGPSLAGALSMDVSHVKRSPTLVWERRTGTLGTLGTLGPC